MSPDDTWKHPYCDNSAHRPGSVVNPQCHRNRQEHVVTIIYDEHGVDTDESRLCQQCFEALVDEARDDYFVEAESVADHIGRPGQPDLRAIAESDEVSWQAKDVAMSLSANEPIGDPETRDNLYARLQDMVDDDDF